MLHTLQFYITYRDENNNVVSTDYLFVQGSDTSAGKIRSFEIIEKGPNWKFFSLYVDD